MCIKCERNIILLDLIINAINELDFNECIYLTEMLSKPIVINRVLATLILFATDAIEIVNGEPEYDEDNMLAVIKASPDEDAIIIKDTIESMFGRILI